MNRKYWVAYLLLIAFLCSCQKGILIKEVVLKPSASEPIVVSETDIVPGEFERIPQSDLIETSYFVKKGNPALILAFQPDRPALPLLKKNDWNTIYRYQVSELGFPKPVYMPDNQTIFMIEPGLCYKLNLTVNTKSDLFEFTEVAFDREWVIWKSSDQKSPAKTFKATIMNLINLEKKTVEIPSEIKSIKACAGFLIIAVQSKPDDIVRWFIYDARKSKLSVFPLNGEKLCSSAVSDILFLSSEKKSEWVIYSLFKNKVIKQIPFSQIPQGNITPYYQNGSACFWWKGEKGQNYIIHGVISDKNDITLSKMKLPGSYEETDFYPVNLDYSSFYIFSSDNASSLSTNLYLISSLPDFSFSLQEKNIQTNQAETLSGILDLIRTNQFFALITKNKLIHLDRNTGDS